MSERNLVRVLGSCAIGLAATLASTSAWSVLNKCTATDGKVSYTEQPCAQNQSQATVKTAAPPPAKGQGSGKRKSPGQVAQCERARKLLESFRTELGNERHKNKTELLAEAKQQMASVEQTIHEQCD